MFPATESPLAVAQTIQLAVAPVFLLVTATEAVVYLAGAAAGIAWLRPDRLLRLRREVSEPPAPPPG